MGHFERVPLSTSIIWLAHVIVYLFLVSQCITITEYLSWQDRMVTVVQACFFGGAGLMSLAQ